MPRWLLTITKALAQLSVAVILGLALGLAFLVILIRGIAGVGSGIGGSILLFAVFVAIPLAIFYQAWRCLKTVPGLATVGVICGVLSFADVLIWLATGHSLRGYPLYILFGLGIVSAEAAHWISKSKKRRAKP